MRHKNLKYLFSTYTLNILNDCKRCFWLHYNAKIERPHRIGILPLTGTHSKIKNYFDKHRGTLPKELKGKTNGSLIKDLTLLRKWRSWGSGLHYFNEKSRVLVTGVLEDCIIEDGLYCPLDYAHIWGAPTKKENVKYFQVQMDVLAYLLEAHNYQPKGVAYVVYYCPKKMPDKGTLIYNIKTMKISASSLRARRLIKSAISIINSPIPESSKTCACCSYYKQLVAVHI